MKILILLIVSLIYYSSRAQERVVIQHETTSILDLINNYTVSQKNKKILVYRIQLLSSESPEKIRWLKDKYIKSFPDERVEEIFESPYFKAFIGSYLDKKKAEKKLLEIKPKFKSSFILKENISMKEYMQNNKLNH